MANIYDYIKDYGNYSFFKKDFNDVDSAVLAVLTYLEFAKIPFKKRDGMTLDEAIQIFLDTVDYRGFVKRGFVQRDIYKLAKAVLGKKRYRDIIIYNYVYKVTSDEQFSAVTLKLPNGIVYVGFEGTDHNMVGWEEDAALCYSYPVPAHIDAIDYLNSTISALDFNVIVAGHSKGGHLALVAAMNANILVKAKISKVYNFDGPGLRMREINSKEYNYLVDKGKYKFIVPNYSFFGMLLRHDPDYKVVKSFKKGIIAHFPTSWEVKDDNFVESELSPLSQKIEVGMLEWLEKHDDEQRKKMFTGIFDVIRQVGIDSTADFKKLKYIVNLVRNANNIDEESRELFLNFLKSNIDFVFDKSSDN